MSDNKITTTEIIESIKNLDHRPDWAEYFMMVAYLISKRSSCERLWVGSVIVKNNRIVSTGYNGHIKGAEHVSKVVDGHEQMTIHAETNAVADAASRGTEINGSTVYVTHFPCINCTKALIASGISHVIYAEDYRNNQICFELFDMAKVTYKKFG